VTVNNKDGDSNGGHNTDAFDVGDSSQITISGATVYNQDDCLAVNSSVGGRDNNIVDTVKILDSQIVDSDNGVRIKTVSGETGQVKVSTISSEQLESS
jgi:polygalacturonase